MEIQFEWQGKVHAGTAEKESRNGIPGYKVTIGKEERFFMNAGYGWSALPDIKSYELKNRIGADIFKAEKSRL